jgi:hypothetical protein
VTEPDEVREVDGAWWVLQFGKCVAGPFTNAEAWSWVDRQGEDDSLTVRTISIDSEAFAAKHLRYLFACYRLLRVAGVLSPPSAAEYVWHRNTMSEQNCNVWRNSRACAVPRIQRSAMF